MGERSRATTAHIAATKQDQNKELVILFDMERVSSDQEESNLNGSVRREAKHTGDAERSKIL